MRVLSLCMIVRNEEANLPTVLGSVQGLVDEMVVVDTGSTDRTIEVAESWGARVDRIEWEDDFAAARNHSLSLAKGEWILVLDGDDEFECADIPLAKELVRTTQALGLLVHQRSTYPDGPTVVNHRMLFFRNLPTLRYVFRVHEEIAVDSSRAQATSLRAYHHGYTPELLKIKRERNLRLLERMKSDPHPRARVAARYYRGTVLEENLLYREASYEYSCGAYSGVASGFRLYCVLGLARVSVALEEPNFAEALYRSVLAANPEYLEPRLGLADVLYRQGKLVEAREHFRHALRSEARLLSMPQEPWESQTRRRLEILRDPCSVSA